MLLMSCGFFANQILLLLSRKMKKRNSSDPSLPLSGGLMSWDQHFRQASTLLDPHWGNTVLGFLLVGAEKRSLGAENIKSRKFVDSEVPPHQDLGHLCAKI